MKKANKRIFYSITLVMVWAFASQYLLFQTDWLHAHEIEKQKSLSLLVFSLCMPQAVGSIIVPLLTKQKSQLLLVFANVSFLIAFLIVSSLGAYVISCILLILWFGSAYLQFEATKTQPVE